MTSDIPVSIQVAEAMTSPVLKRQSEQRPLQSGATASARSKPISGCPVCGMTSGVLTVTQPSRNLMVKRAASMPPPT